jgi:hypothetical protein
MLSRSRLRITFSTSPGEQIRDQVLEQLRRRLAEHLEEMRELGTTDQPGWRWYE